MNFSHVYTVKNYSSIWKVKPIFTRFTAHYPPSPKKGSFELTWELGAFDEVEGARKRTRHVF